MLTHDFFSPERNVIGDGFSGVSGVEVSGQAEN
jgi:hypothetical protein